MVSTCPLCERIVHQEDAVYCPFCGASLRDKPTKVTTFPAAAGILAIVTACMCTAWGVIGIAKFTLAMSYYDYYYYNGLPIGLYLIEGILGLVAFVLGLIGGIMSLKRQRISLGILGASFMVYSGIAVTLAFGLMDLGLLGWGYGLTFGVPTVCLSVLVLIFIMVSRSEFRGKTRRVQEAKPVESPENQGRVKSENVRVSLQSSEFDLEDTSRTRKHFPTIGGFLAVVAAGLCLIISLFYVVSFAIEPMYISQFGGLLEEGAFGLVVSLLGLSAGVLSLKRSGFEIALIGLSFLLAQGFVITAAVGSQGLLGTPSYGPVLGSPIVGLSITSLTLIGVSKTEFRRPAHAIQ
jgi:hypothetical protein